MTFIDAASDHPTTVLTGSSICLTTVQSVDLTTGKPSFTLNNAPTGIHLHALSYVTMATDLIATSSGQNGDIDIWDMRVSGGGSVTKVTTTGTKVGIDDTKEASETSHLSHVTNSCYSQSFGFTVSHDSHPGMKLALLCASTGLVQLYDSRQPRTMYACGQTNSTSEGVGAVRSWFRRTSLAPRVKVHL